MVENKDICGIGQILTFTKDREFSNGIFGEKEVVKKGTQVFVGADEFIHYKNGDIQPIVDFEIKGYSVKGIAEWLYLWISRRFEIDEMLEGYENTKDDFKEEIMEALEDLGFYDHTGNRS